MGIQFQHCDSDSQCCFVSKETTDVKVTRGTLWSDKTVGFWCQTIHQKFLRRFDTIFGLKMMMKSGVFEIPRWPSEIPANLQGQFSLSGQIVLHWAAATLKVIVEFQNNFSGHFSSSFLKAKNGVKSP